MEQNIIEVTGNDLLFAKVRGTAILPTKDDENAGYDIYANFQEDFWVIYPGQTRLVPTGIACAVAPEYYLQVEERGSTGSKGIKKSAGVIDSGYRGEIFIALTNCNSIPIVITDKNKTDLPYHVSLNPEGTSYSDIIVYPKSKAIAQLIVHRVEKMNVKEITYEDLLKIPSKRGAGALGSSGK